MEKSKFFISPMTIKMICWAMFWILVIMMCAHYQHFVLSAFAFMALVISMLITYVENLNADDEFINLDADPFVPEGWTVEKHQNGGTFKWNPNEVLLYLSKLQKDGESIKGNKLREELVGRRIFNANLLDWLMVHQNLIPEEWKHDEQGHPLFIFFWGTIYNRPSGILCVRGIYWRGNRWHCSFRWLNDGWNGSSPAAMRVISIL